MAFRAMLGGYYVIEDIIDSFSVVAKLSRAIARKKSGELMDFEFSVYPLEENPDLNSSDVTKCFVYVDFKQDHLTFRSVPTRMGDVEQKAIELALLRATATVKSNTVGTYINTPSVKQVPTPPYKASIPFFRDYSLGYLEHEFFSAHNDNLDIKYKKIDVNHSYMEVEVAGRLGKHNVSLRCDTLDQTIKATCDCPTFQMHRGLHLCPHIRALIENNVDNMPPLFFNPAFTERQIIEELMEYVRPGDPVFQAKEVVLSHDDEGNFMLKPKHFTEIIEPTDTLQKLGIKDNLLQTNRVAGRQKNIDSNCLFFFVRPRYSGGLTDVQYCDAPEPAKGKIGKTGKLTLTFSTITADKVSQQVSQLSGEEMMDAFAYLGIYKETFNNFNHHAIPDYNANMQRALPILQKYPTYFYIDRWSQDKSMYKGLDRLTQLTLHTVYAEASLHLQKIPNDSKHIALNIQLHAGDDILEIDPATTLLHETFIILNYKDLYLFRSAGDYHLAHQHYKQMVEEANTMLYEANALPELYDSVIKPLGKHFQITSEVHDIQPLETAEVTPQLFLSDTEEGDVLLTPAMQYGHDSIPLYDRAPLYDAQSTTLLSRDSDRESQYLDYLRSLHPDFDRNMEQFVLSPEQLIEDNWLLTTSEKLRQRGVQIFGSESLKNFRFCLHTPTISISTSSGIDWFDLKIDVAFGKQKVPLRELRRSVINRSRYVLLSDGTLGILPEEWLERYAKYFQAGRVEKDKLEISTYQFNIIDQLYDDLPKRPKHIEAMMERKQRLQNLTKITPHPVPKGIEAELRNYQKSGFEWLLFLRENQLGGCLADDMGLGKTLQVITLLQHIKEEQKRKKSTPPHLIVLPTSLLFNWQKELQKFAPSLTFMVYRGGDRAIQREAFKKYDIILSTYGVVANDIEHLAEVAFDYVILDESQAIKNPFSKRYKAVRLLQGNHRLALTGTPIENNTFDLYAQLNFLNPGIFGSMDHFRQNFSNAIDRDRDEKTTHLLRDMTKPFILRRTKKQVATELPEKTESILYCEMKEEQRKVYDAYKERYRSQLLGVMEESGEGEAQMMVLQALTKLRQICNSPALISTDADDYGTQSIKLDLIIRNLKDIVGGHKALVFSQFTSMLALVQKRLQLEGISYVYLDGSTTNREEVVAHFQEDDEIRVFLISLKAGGTGLNLTAADYVFLLDPWWNPAVENQAIDRAYRIGQEKHVNAYRMVCKDTIEEKIIELQSSKRALSEDIIQTDKIQKSFSREDVANLFK